MTAQPLDVNSVSALVADAGAAPLLHDAQPWRLFRFPRDSAALRLYPDLERTIPPTDPDERGPHLGCGAAILNLPVAAAATGPAPVVRLLPDPDDAELTAEAGLYGSEPPDEALARLQPASDSTAGRPMPGRSWASFEKNPHLTLLGTPRDGPADWLRAGQALERVLLQATTDGLVASKTSQPLEWPENSGERFATPSRPWHTCRWCSGSATAPKATRAGGDRWPTCSTSSETGLVA